MSYIGNVERESLVNTNFRKVLYTAKYCQLVVMHLQPSEDIGEEVHTLDQFIRIEKGQAKAVLNDVESPLGDGDAVIVPAGTKHNIINASSTEPVKLYTVYAPPEHRDGTVHVTKADAQADTQDHYQA